MAESGTLVNVATTNVGEFLTADVPANSVVLPVTDATTFDEAGGYVTVSGDTYSNVYQYSGIDGANNLLYLRSGSGLLLALGGAGLTVAAAADDRVEIYPPRPQKQALIDLGVEEGEAVYAIVPHELTAVIPDGFREEGYRETVLVGSRDTGELYVDDLFATAPVIEAPVLSSDGLPPIASPTPVVTGWIGALHCKWQPIEGPDLVSYEVHISATSGFTPDTTTQVGITLGTSFTIRSLPNDLLLAYGVTYYVKIVAFDDDGAAAPGGEGSAQMQPATGPDIAATYVYAGSVSASQIEGGTISGDLIYAGKLATALSGPRVEQDASGITIFDTTGTPTTDLNTDATSVFRGDAEIGGLTVKNAMSIRGMANELSTGAELQLASGITAPSTGPSVVQDWESITFTKAGDATFNPANITSIQWNVDRWICGYRDGSYYKVYAFNSDGTFNSLAADQVLSSTALQTIQIGAGGYCYSVASNNTIYRHRKLTSTYTTTDDFTSSLSGIWVSTSNAVWDSGSGGRAKLTGDSHIMTANTYDMKSGSVQAKINRTAGSTGQDIFLTIRHGSGEEMAQIKFEASTLFFRVYDNAWDGSLDFETTITYNATNHAYWKVWEEDTAGGGGNFHFATSPDGVSWTERAVFDHDFTVTQMGAAEIRFTGQDSGLTFYVDEFRYGPANEGISSAAYDTQNNDGDPMTIGTDGTNILLAEHDNSGGDDRLRVRVITPPAWDVVSTFNGASHSSFDGPLAGILLGNFDYGASRYVTKAVGSLAWKVVNSSTGAYSTSDDFDADGGGSKSIGWDGSNFWALGTNGAIYKHYGNLLTGTYLAGFTWYDSNATGGTHETTISPLSSFTLKKRARLTLTGAQIPGAGGSDDPNSVRFYVGTSSGAMKLQSTTGVGGYSATYTSISTGGAAPPGANNFPGGTPAKIKSSTGGLVISGDGSVAGLAPAPTELGNAINLDSVTTPGWYSQTSDAEAAAGTNYPVPYAGLLEVVGIVGVLTMQRYHGARNADITTLPSIWERFYNGTSWSAWIPIHDQHGDDTTVSNCIVAATGWSITSVNFRLYNKMLSMRINFNRSGTTITSTSNDGNVANQTIGTCTAKYRTGTGTDQHGLTIGATGKMIMGLVTPTGDVIISAAMIDVTASGTWNVFANAETFSIGGVVLMA